MGEITVFIALGTATCLGTYIGYWLEDAQHSGSGRSFLWAYLFSLGILAIVSRPDWAVFFGSAVVCILMVGLVKITHLASAYDRKQTQKKTNVIRDNNNKGRQKNKTNGR